MGVYVYQGIAPAPVCRPLRKQELLPVVCTNHYILLNGPFFPLLINKSIKLARGFFLLHPSSWYCAMLLIRACQTFELTIHVRVFANATLSKAMSSDIKVFTCI